MRKHLIWERVIVDKKNEEETNITRKGEPSYFDFIGKKNVIHK